MDPTSFSRTRSAGFLLGALPWVLLATGCSGTVDDAAEPPGGVARAAQAAVAVSPGVEAGAQHSLVLRADGSVWAFGANAQGQLGDGTTTDRLTPVQVPGLNTMIGVAAGDNHSLAVGGDGSVWAWGANTYGQLGDGSTTPRAAPVQVPGLSQAVAIASGAHHALALQSDGSVWAWGRNNAGQLGDGTNVSRTSPVAVSGPGTVIAIAAGDYHSLALRTDGSIWAWGQNGSGQLGNGTTAARTTPAQVAGLAGVVDLAAGGNHSLALGADGSVWAWGHNGFGQLGDGTLTQRLTPVQVSGVAGAIALAAGRSHSLALGPGGAVQGWGWNTSGQLGHGATTSSPVPVQAAGVEATAIGAGVAHSLAMEADGAVMAWGRGLSGQLGDGAQTNQPVPVQALPTWTCAPGSTASCYSGPPGTVSVGVCQAGTRTCNAQGTAYGPCVGEVTPGAESCSGSSDEDCDGVVNEGCFIASCFALRQANPSAPSGVYTINPGGGASAAAYCDMTGDGGGWTKLESAQWPGFFNASNHLDLNGAAPMSGMYSMLGKRAAFADAQGCFTFRLTVGKSGGTWQSAPSVTTVWKQCHDPLTATTTGSDYTFLSGQPPSTCGGFNGLHNRFQGLSYATDVDTNDATGCWWMQIVPTGPYPGFSAYLDGYGGPWNSHTWQVLWVR